MEKRTPLPGGPGTIPGAGAAGGGGGGGGGGQNIQDLAKTVTKGSEKGHGLKVPVIVVLIALLLVAVGAITIPLGAIIATNASNVVDDMTHQVISGVMAQCVNSVKDFLESFAALVHASGENAALDDVFKYHYMDYSISMPNITSVMVHTTWQNEYITAMTCTTYPNHTGLVPLGSHVPNMTSVGILKEPCNKIGLPYDGLCALRIWHDYTTAKSVYAALIDTNTVKDLTPPFNAQPDNSDNLMVFYPRFLELNMQPNFMTDWITGGFSGWMHIYQYIYVPNATRVKETARMCRGYLFMESSLESFFNTVRPTNDSIVFMIDDANRMIVSTVNGTVSPNDTYRYTPTEVPNPIIRGASKSLQSQYGTLSNLPNTTSQMLNIAGDTWIVNTATMYTPHSGQPYQIFLCVLRSDYYGASEAAFKKALIIAIVLTVVGLIFVVGLGYFAVRPLQSLVVSMQTLTHFDFSVLENGDLTNRSLIKEIYQVENTFITMVKAFAAAIRNNKELTSRNRTTSTSKGAGQTYSSNSLPTTSHNSADST
ncbi:hypothetical protein HDU76_000881 [Blyttiomyces sp. JEL0837]|nr:hypothetical protein HDU76_000881 [Blyttiomyces sp. JEL0837]